LIKTLRQSAFKNGYLVITAAWLYTLSFIFVNYWSYTSSPNRVKQRLERYLEVNEKQFVAFSKDTSIIRGIINETIGDKQVEWFTEEKPRLFVYAKNDLGNLLLNFWNTHEIVPQPKDLERPDGKYFVVYPNGEFEFIKKSVRLDGKRLVVAAMIPLRWNFFLNNSYLKTEFAAISRLESRYDLVLQKGDIEVKNSDGKVLFGLKEKEKKAKDYYDRYSLGLRILSLIFIIVFFNVLATDLGKNLGPLKGVLFLAGIIILLRFLSYHFPIPFNYRQFELFDPFVYASNNLHPSLGDLLINMILLFWLLSFFKLSSLSVIDDLKPVKGRSSWVLAFILCGILIALSFVAANVVRSLIVDSKISFDVGNFFSLSIYTFVSFLVLCFITLSFFHLSHIILLILNKLDDIPWWGRYFLVTIVGLLFLSFTLPSAVVVSNLCVLGWLLVYLFVMEKRKVDLYKPLMRSSFFIIWLIFFAGSISALIIFQNRIVEHQVRKRKAEDLAVQNDPSGQNILSIAVLNFNIAFLAENFPRLQSPLSNRSIKDSVINDNFSGYLNQYDTRIYTFDKSFNSLYNEDSVSYEVITNIIANRSKNTNIPDLYYHENSFESYSYIFQKEIRSYEGDTLGYFFVLAKPKRYQSEALYPELFKQVRDINSDLSVNYAYAVYDKGKLITNYGDYNFVSQLPKDKWPRQEFKEAKEGSYDALWYNAGNNKVVVIIKHGTMLFEAITLFAYLFGSFLFILIMFHVGNLLLRTRFRWRSIKETFRFNIRNQIQTTILFISIFSFLVIGAATISFYIARFETNNRERLVKAIQVMAKEIQSQVAAHELSDDVVKIYDEGASSRLEATIGEISEIHSVDVNFYDVGGTLKVSTQPYIYKKQILSHMMDPEAYYRLHYNNEIQVIQKETVGHFSYLSIYVPIRNQDGQAYAYINIPYLNSQMELKQEISNFLVTLINLNAFIFVLAGVIAILLTNRITYSFTLIGNKMRDINLGKFNEEISWNTNDEIGALVNEYNKMVRKLEESAQALAKSEREGAWREMARQVAHEIKNPLTPMKLSIQYLQRSIAEKKPGIQVLSQKVAATLVEQIDQLAKIASDFSQFANIEHVKNEVFNVSDVLSSLMDLYSSNENIQLNWQKLDKPAFIKADKTQVNRLFTNLLQNAIEASSNKENPTIIIRQSTDDDKLTISITDEGIGIPLAMQEKIFTPNFTTKSSGTGLGLAICKGIVEKANGKIWFTTKEDEGSTFYVMFPLSLKPV
jgi:two-component system nitrogen regulation sensor histidine kinase NtrY